MKADRYAGENARPFDPQWETALPSLKDYLTGLADSMQEAEVASPDVERERRRKGPTLQKYRDAVQAIAVDLFRAHLSDPRLEVGIFQKAKTAHKAQVDLLLESAARDGFCPVYCFYCAERHRDIWTVYPSAGVAETLETGCLLSPASTVRSIAPTQLSEIEAFTLPWHFLWAEKAYSVRKSRYGLRYQDDSPTDRYLEEIEV